MEISYQIGKAEAEQCKYFLQFNTLSQFPGNAQNYRAFDQNSLLVGKLGQEVIGTIVALKYSKFQALICAYFIKQAYRGKGYGIQLFEKATEYLKDCENVRLNCRQQMVPMYSKVGFKIIGKQQILVSNELLDIGEVSTTTNIVTDLQKIEISEVFILDGQLINGRRDVYLQATFKIGKVFFSYDKNTKKLLGYACVNKIREEFLWVTVLMADNEAVAEDLLKSIFKCYYELQVKLGFPLKLSLRYGTTLEAEQRSQLVYKWFPNLQINIMRMCLSKNELPKQNPKVYGLLRL